jgi:phosphotriesterase-related protein
MNRKKFLKQFSASALAVSTGFIPSLKTFGETRFANSVVTVTGSIPAKDLGLTLIHEHLLSIFGTNPQEPAEYDEQQALEEVVPYLKYIKSLGCDSIVDCSAAYLGRNAALLKKIAEQSELQILISTGIYGAAEDRYIPDYAYGESAGQLAARWSMSLNRESRERM